MRIQYKLFFCVCAVFGFGFEVKTLPISKEKSQAIYLNLTIVDNWIERSLPRSTIPLLDSAEQNHTLPPRKDNANSYNEQNDLQRFKEVSISLSCIIPSDMNPNFCLFDSKTAQASNQLAIN